MAILTLELSCFIIMIDQIDQVNYKYPICRKKNKRELLDYEKETKIDFQNIIGCREVHV